MIVHFECKLKYTDFGIEISDVLNIWANSPETAIATTKKIWENEFLGREAQLISITI